MNVLVLMLKATFHVLLHFLNGFGYWNIHINKTKYVILSHTMKLALWSSYQIVIDRYRYPAGMRARRMPNSWLSSCEPKNLLNRIPIEWFARALSKLRSRSCLFLRLLVCELLKKLLSVVFGIDARIINIKVYVTWIVTVKKVEVLIKVIRQNDNYTFY